MVPDTCFAAIAAATPGPLGISRWIACQQASDTGQAARPRQVPLSGARRQRPDRRRIAWREKQAPQTAPCRTDETRTADVRDPSEASVRRR